MTTLELKAQAEEANWRMAHEWHAGLTLMLSGADLADAMTYDVLRVCGGVWKTFMDNLEKANDGAPATQSS